METIWNYLKQASTYKGLFSILGAFGIAVSPEMSGAIITAVLGIIGLIDVIVDERKK